MNDSFMLRNGVNIPKIMIGTYSINNDKAYEVFRRAYEIGYRGVDCGRYYKNEKDWGTAIKKSGINREDIFIQTKVDYSQERLGLDVEKDFELTLQNFQTDYIDSLLIHWPVYATFIDTWNVLEKLYSEGKVRTIGVSNFRIEHFELLKKHCSITPMICQIERHPCRKQEEILSYCQQNNILVQAYQPLAVCLPPLMKNKVLLEIANKHNCSVPQVALAWNIQSGVVPLPRSQNPGRLAENYSSIKIVLSTDEMKKINDDKDNYYRVMKESVEFPGYWDEIHKVEVEEYLGERK